MSDTVLIKRDGPRGFRRINAIDFDPKVHEVYEMPAPVEAVAPPALVPPPPPPPGPLDNLPKDWRNSKTVELRAIAERVGGRTPDNREQAIQMIEAALAAK